MSDNVENADAKVLKVSEGRRGPRERIFSVVLDKVLDSEDLSVVATAKDPKSKLAIPATGEKHPQHGDLAATPPTIFCVGLRMDGVLVATRSRFFNVRVRYEECEPPQDHQ